MLLLDKGNVVIKLIILICFMCLFTLASAVMAVQTLPLDIVPEPSRLLLLGIVIIGFVTLKRKLA